MVLKLLAYGLYEAHDAYLKNKWNWLDGTIVITAYIPIIITSLSSNVIFSIFVSFRPLKMISSLYSI